MDWTAALENAGDDRELLAELAAMFAEDFPRFADEAGKAVAGRDAETLTREAHTLKGRMAFFGFEAFRERAEALEELGRQARLAEAGKALDALVLAITAVLPEFRELRT